MERKMQPDREYIRSLEEKATRATKALALLCLLLVVLILLSGCTTPGQPLLAPCQACVGPYDLGLSSHREALLGKTP